MTTTRRAVLGESLPEPLARYYTAIDGGDPATAAASFTTDAVYAVPPLGVPGELAAHLVIRGREPLQTWIAALPRRGVTHENFLCAIDPDTGSALIEGAVADASGAVLLPYLVSASFAGGLVSRYVAYTCSIVQDAMVAPADATTTEAAAVDAGALVARYFALLDDGDFVGAVECFSPDVVYSHPPYRHTDNAGGDRVTFRGRGELLSAFQARGRQSFSHTIRNSAQAGPFCIFEGSMSDLPNGGSGGFMSSLTLDAEGRMARYLSMYREPEVL